MSFESIDKKLDEIASYDMTDTARLRYILDDVESLLSIGVKIHQVLAYLNDKKMNFTAGSFQTTLYRLRKESGGKKKDKVVSNTKLDKPTQTVKAEEKKETSSNTRKLGGFELPAQKVFEHNPNPDIDDLLG